MKALILSALLLFSALAQASPQGRWFDRVILIVLENEDGADVARDRYFASLAGRGTSFSGWATLLHPSYPNYLAMTAGDTFGIRSDSQRDLDARHLGDLLEAKGEDWRVYAEGYPGNCFLGSSRGNYARKHVPFLSFRNVQNDKARCAKIVNAREFQRDLEQGDLPAYSLYIPDNRNNGHDTGLGYASRWLEGFLEPVLESLPARTLVVVTFDESEIGFGGSLEPIYTAFLGSMVKPGQVISREVDHFDLLRTIEDNFSLGTLGKNDSKAAAIILP